jgi:hypothetical protein
MSEEQKIDDIIKRLDDFRLQIQEIKSDYAKMSQTLERIKNLPGPDAYIMDYSSMRLNGINSELQNTIDYLNKNENLEDEVKVKKYLNEFSSRLAHLTLMFELYYLFRIAHVLALPSDVYPSNLVGLDWPFQGFYIAEDSFEKLVEEKDYASLRTELSRIKDRFDEVSNRWTMGP